MVRVLIYLNAGEFAYKKCIYAIMVVFCIERSFMAEMSIHSALRTHNVREAPILQDHDWGGSIKGHKGQLLVRDLHYLDVSSAKIVTNQNMCSNTLSDWSVAL